VIAEAPGAGVNILFLLTFGVIAPTTSSKEASIGSISSGFFLGTDEFLVGQALLRHAIDCHADELESSGLRCVVSEGELIDIAMQMLRAHVVVDAVVTALQKRPEAFDAICMEVVTDILANRVIDRLVREAFSGKASVRIEVVCHDRSASRSVGANEALECWGLRVRYWCSANLIVLIADTNDSNLANRATTRIKFLVGVLVLLFAAYKRLIDLNVVAHIGTTASAKPRFADALREKPSRLLSDAEFTRHLSGGNALAGAGEHEDRE